MLISGQYLSCSYIWFWNTALSAQKLCCYWLVQYETGEKVESTGMYTILQDSGSDFYHW